MINFQITKEKGANLIKKFKISRFIVTFLQKWVSAWNGSDYEI